EPGAADPCRGREVREQRDPERAASAADEAAGGTDHRRLGARAVGPRHREPGRRGGPGAGLEEHGELHHQGAAGAIPGVPRHGLGEVKLLVLSCDAIYLPTRPSGAKEGVLVAWGYDGTGQRVLLDLVLGQRERFED